MLMVSFVSLLIVLLTAGCGGEKRFPSSNPPEYDPKKVYTTPVSPPASSSQSTIQPSKSEPLPAAIAVPCEKQPKQSDREEPPVACGQGIGGAGGAGGGGGGRRSAGAAAKRPSYVLEFQSMIVLTDPDSEPAQSQASGVIQLEAHYDKRQGHVAYRTGPLPNWEPCTALVRGEGTVPIRVFQAFIHVEQSNSTTAVSRGGTAKIELLYGLLGASQETSTGMPYMLEHQCVPNKPQWHPFWSTNYISGRGEIAGMPEQMFLLKDWTYVGQNGVVATITLQSTCGGMCDREVCVFTLKEAESMHTAPPR